MNYLLRHMGEHQYLADVENEQPQKMTGKRPMHKQYFLVEIGRK